MIRSFLKNGVRKFGRKWDYDTTYMEEICDADPAAVVKLSMAGAFLKHSGDVPIAVWHAAHLRSLLAADCGPCLKLGINMAMADGLPKQTVAAILRGTANDADMALAIRYADAVVSNGPETMETVEAVRQRFGRAAMAPLAAAVVSGAFYPLFKRGLGHAASCVPVLRELEAA